MTATNSSRNAAKSVPRRTIRCTLSRSLNTSTNCSNTVWNASRSVSLNATSATTCTRPSPHAIEGSAMPIAMRVCVAVMPIACGTASASVNAVDEIASRSTARST